MVCQRRCLDVGMATLTVIFLQLLVRSVIANSHSVQLCVSGRLEAQISEVEDLFTCIYMTHYGGS